MELFAGPVQVAATCASTANELDGELVTLTGTAAFKGSVAVSASLEAVAEMPTLGKLAEPDDKAMAVWPPSVVVVSARLTVPEEANVAATPLSVSATTGAGMRAT
jgi:hypothetical protein